MKYLKIPDAPGFIQKGVPLKLILDKSAIVQLGTNLEYVYNDFDKHSFINESMADIAPLSITDRSKKIASLLKKYLPQNYTAAIHIILKSLTPPLIKTENNGLAPLFYMPYVSFIAKYGLDKDYNNHLDPFELSMTAQYELTQRFTAEFSIRPFIIDQPIRTFEKLHEWISDPNPHVRRLCSEGTRPRLPWALKIPSLIIDPSPSIEILEKLKNDENLYIRRSVANHMGDIAKDNLELALNICDSWLNAASKELKWVIRHALRYPAKKGNVRALELRINAK